MLMNKNLSCFFDIPNQYLTQGVTFLPFKRKHQSSNFVSVKFSLNFVTNQLDSGKHFAPEERLFNFYHYSKFCYSPVWILESVYRKMIKRL